MAPSVCAICTNILDDTQILVSTKCHHTFHQNCVTSYLEKNPLCPICKSSINNTTLTHKETPHW